MEEYLKVKDHVKNATLLISHSILFFSIREKADFSRYQIGKGADDT